MFGRGDTDYEDKCPENYNLEADCDGNFPNTENDTFDTDCPDHGYYEYEEDICPEMYHMREQVEDPAVTPGRIIFETAAALCCGGFFMPNLAALYPLSAGHS